MKSGIAIVTGASSGIGAQTAIRLAKDFTGIVLVARRGELLQQTAGEVQGKGVSVHTIVADLHQPAAAEDIVRQTIDRFRVTGFRAFLFFFQFLNGRVQGCIKVDFLAWRWIPGDVMAAATRYSFEK